ncbi:MAG: hypothetical protein FJX76_21470 [Armatimonadetes bacterium]|nr:hypothetical protein [Armatimonadota bacterium]
MRPVTPVTLQSPYAPRQSLPTATAPQPADSVRLSGATPAEEPARETSLGWRAMALGALTAVSVLAPGASTALAQTAPQIVATTTTTTATRDALIEEMLRLRPAGRQPSQSSLEQARATLRTVPADVLRTLAANGTHVVILQPGQSLLEAGVVHPVDLGRYADAAALGERARVARVRVEAHYGPRIADLEARVDAAGMADSEDFQYAQVDLADARAERDALARRAMHEATDGLVDPALAEAGGGMFGHMADVMPVTLRELAKEAGAQTPEQQREFIDIVQRLNGGRIARAESLYGRAQSGPRQDRRLMAREAGLLVPAYVYQDGQRLSVHDAGAVDAWIEQAARAQYFYPGAVNTVVVRADALGPQEDGHDVLLHELGHAYEDAVATLAPHRFAAYRAERDAAFMRLRDNPDHPYHLDHAGSSPSEMAAETFSDSLRGNTRALRGADPRWMDSFEAYRNDTRVRNAR